MSFLDKIIAIWQNVNVVQRTLLTAVILAVAGVGFLLTHWATKPDMRMLYQDMSADEACKIVEKISDKQIPYELRNGGTSVYVPKQNVYQLRLDMAKEGLPTGGRDGYKIFDNEKIGISPFVQNVNLQRAIQDELAKSVSMIDGVDSCRVHMVTADQSLFADEKTQTSASVILRLAHGYKMSQSNITAIIHLVAGSVEGLSTNNITIVDSYGNLLSQSSDGLTASGAENVQDYKERLEQKLADKVENMLTAVLGPGKATIRVSATVDMTSINLVTESYDPTKKVATKEEITTNSETKGGSTGENASAGDSKKDETIVTEYKVGKVIEQRTELPGTIQSLSVAAFVDLSPADSNSQNAQAGNAVMTVSDVEEIIKNALGLKDTDSLKVVPVKFNRPAEIMTAEQESPKFDKYILIAKNTSIGIVAICALIVLKIFSGARKKTQGADAQDSLALLEAGTGIIPTGHSTTEPALLQKRIANALENNPDQVKQLFSNWIQEGNKERALNG
jgi:flagellar M-ring protein FliF